MIDSSKEVLHWIVCAERSIRDADNLKEAILYMARAESVAEDVFDWTCMAKGWSQVLDDHVQVSRSMDKANQLTITS